MVQYVIDNNIGFNRIDADTKKSIKYKEGKFEWEKEAEKGDIEI